MPMQGFDRSLPMMLYRALNSVMPRFRSIFAEFGLTEPQWRVMRVLWERREVGFGELASLTLVPAPSLVGVLDRLTAAGFVLRHRSRADRRSVTVCATSAGLALEAQVTPLVESSYAELRKAVDPAVWQDLLTGLESIAAIDQTAGQGGAGDENQPIT